MGGKLNVYERLMEEFKRLIDLGALKYGEKLPSCRALATERGINPNTVERAYSELEAEWYIHILPKKGAYVERAATGGVRRRSESSCACSVPQARRKRRYCSSSKRCTRKAKSRRRKYDRI